MLKFRVFLHSCALTSYLLLAALTASAQNTPLTITSGQPPDGALQNSYSFRFTATETCDCSTPTFTWSISTPPQGLSISDSTGVLSGTPTSAGPATFTVTVNDQFQNQKSATYTININSSLVITTASGLASGKVGVPYSLTFGAVGGAGPSSYCWFSTGDSSPPPGIRFQSECGGTISGTPTSIGTYIFSIGVDSNSTEATQQFVIYIGGATDPGPTSGVVDYVLNAEGSIVQLGKGSSLLCPSSVCPDGANDFALDASGNFIIAGYTVLAKVTPAGAASVIATAPQNGDFYSVAIDPSGNYIVADDSRHLILKYAPSGGSPTTISSYSVPDTESGEDVYVRMDASGNYIVAEDNTATFRLFKITPQGTGGATPLSLTGVNPTYVGGLTVDGSGNYVVTDFSNPSVVKFTSNGSGGYVGSYIVNDTTIQDPFGLVVDSTGNFLVTNDPGDGQLYSVTPSGQVNLVADGLSNPYAVLTVGSKPANAPPIPPQLQVSGGYLGEIGLGQSFSRGLTVYGGTPPYTFGASGLPAGITLNGSVLSGTPVAAGNYNFFVRATDSAGSSASNSASLSVFGVAGGVLAPGAQYAYYSAAINTAGGAGPYTFSGTGLPRGLQISDGFLAGTPTVAGNFTFNVAATDANGVASSSNLTLTVSNAPPLKVIGGALPDIQVQTPASLQFAATGGAQPYSWSLAGGNLSSGLTVRTPGVLAGIPTQPGAYSFSARVTDNTGASAIGSFTINVLSSPVTITSPSPLATGMATVDYPNQSLSASGGVSPYTFAVTAGAVPPGLTLTGLGGITGTPTASGSSSFSVTATDAKGATGTAALNITVRPFAPDLIASSGSISFAIAAGTTTLPSAQTIQVQATDVTQFVNYTAVVSPSSASWLSVTPSASVTPGAITVALTNAALALVANAAPYQASIVLTCTSNVCAGHTQTVNVSLSVTKLPAQLSVLNDSLAFNAIASAPVASTQVLGIQDTGGASIGFASVQCQATWCKLSGIPGTLAPGATANILVTADPTGLAAGYYWTDISIVTSAGVAIVPVTFFIPATGSLSLAPAGAQYTLPQGGAAVGATSFLVAVSGPASVAWSAKVLDGAPWLSVNPASGSSSGNQPAASSLVFDPVAVAALAPGNYYATVRVSSDGAINSPQDFRVVLNVTPATLRQKPNPVPGGLLFLPQSSSAPAPQTVALYVGTTTPIGYQASVNTADGANWLSVSPATGLTSATSPAQATVSVNPGSLKAGIYTGLVSFAFSGSAVRSVNVTLVVKTQPPPFAAGVSTTLDAAAVNCVPAQIVPTQTALVSNFATPAAWPTELAIQLVDDCGTPVSNGQLVTLFSNGDPPLVLSPSDPLNGLYDATWTPRKPGSQVNITVRASAPGFPSASTQLAGAVVPNNAPVIAHNATTNLFFPSPGAPLAPGTLVQIAGQYLAGQTLTNTVVPAPASLGGVSVIIGGVQSPVTFVSPGQVNAQIPFELNPGQPYQVVVNANGALATPDSFQAGTVSPALSVLSTGYVSAQHSDGSAIAETSPAKPGEQISITLSGMGPTDVPVPTGTGSPGSPAANVSNPPSITLGNEAVTFTFAGLQPGQIGVYQVQMQVPSDAPNGDLTLTVTQTGVSTNSGILPVHN